MYCFYSPSFSSCFLPDSLFGTSSFCAYIDFVSCHGSVLNICTWLACKVSSEEILFLRSLKQGWWQLVAVKEELLWHCIPNWMPTNNWRHFLEEFLIANAVVEDGPSLHSGMAPTSVGDGYGVLEIVLDLGKWCWFYRNGETVKLEMTDGLGEDRIAWSGRTHVANPNNVGDELWWRWDCRATWILKGNCGLDEMRSLNLDISLGLERHCQQVTTLFSDKCTHFLFVAFSLLAF